MLSFPLLSSLFRLFSRKHCQSPPPSVQIPDHDKKCCYFNLACDYSYGPESDRWLPTESPPVYTKDDPGNIDLGVLRTVEETVDRLSPNLRELSMQIHSHPELMFIEKQAHDWLSEYMSRHGFKVTPHYLGLSTAWRAEYQHGKGGIVIGINSEMDALAGIGHACGHNLIAVSGVGVAIAVKTAMEIHNISGKVILLGTPAEEGGGGKVILLERGGYEDMDACLMCHPSPGLPHSISVGTTIAMQQIDVEYFGHSAHAGAAPWEGTNALDAAFLAYSSISVLRQQMKPDCRIHGVVQGKEWSPNVIPDYARMRWLVRAPTYAELVPLVERAKNCFNGAALATSCTINLNSGRAYYELNQNDVLAQEFADIVGSRYGMLSTTVSSSASTDFGNVSYALPSLHPAFAIPTEPRGGNHTPAFAKSAATLEAHNATMTVTKGLALIALRILSDHSFLSEVRLLLLCFEGKGG
ncbi:hypothetical protein AMATHDRAFT_74704 [Amanita thiersii Skay4041]|uniref:Peptidase M20 dimerisation domain-containing protein n=1 Tax=Amanita thiersii Skay4041 TaxID=703135 RepID=A0A2A9NLG7_9AGAR|nr:hypothetical protein AMATHDRAFT_74704 [Amanita thiersii Skay4041]